MSEDVRFEKREGLDSKMNHKVDEVVVIRDGREVAVLPEAGRLDRALSLPLEEASWIERNFPQVMNRQPTPDEREFWRAVVDYKRSHQYSLNDYGEANLEEDKSG